MSMWESDRIWSKTEWIWVWLNGSGHIWGRLSESEWDCVKFCESERIRVKLWKLSKSVWDCKNLCESEHIWLRLGWSGWDWVILDWNEWIWTSLDESDWIWLGLSDSLCVRCKTPSKTSETPPFPPISYPALAGLIGRQDKRPLSFYHQLLLSSSLKPRTSLYVNGRALVR